MGAEARSFAASSRVCLRPQSQGTPTSGLDANFHGPYLSLPGLGVLDVPPTTHTSDGFGGNGTGGARVTFDSGDISLGEDDSIWVSDEYGPYVYEVSSKGKMIGAIRPPDAAIPRRNSSESFSADSPPRYDQYLEPMPADHPTSGDGIHGSKGLTTNPQGTNLLVTYEAEFIVPLKSISPNYTSSKVAHPSVIHHIRDTQFLVMARDSSVGRGQNDTMSLYRHVDVFDISDATNIKGHADCSTCSVASTKGVLNEGYATFKITPAE